MADFQDLVNQISDQYKVVKDSNVQLKADIAKVTKERDDYKAKLEAATKPTTPTNPPPTRKTVFGSISDWKLKPGGRLDAEGTAKKHAPYMREQGLKGLRLWQTADPLNGYFWPESCEIANNLRWHAGSTANIVTLAVPTNTNFKWADANFQRIADYLKAGKLDKSNMLSMFNEVNSGTYSPGGDYVGAFAAADKWARVFRSYGYKVGSPSFAYNDPGGLTNMMEKVRKNYEAFDFVCGNTYNSDPKAFRATVKAYSDFAKSLGKPLAMTEWGVDTYNAWHLSDADFAAKLSEYFDALREYADFAYYFIMTPHAEPKAKYLVDLNTDTRKFLYEPFRVQNNK